MTEHCSLTDLDASPGFVRRMRADDVAAAASMHCRVFPDYFLTHMGRRFVQQFYAEFVDHEGNYGLVAISDGKLVGSVLGTLDYGRFFNRFYRQHFLSAAATLVGRFFVDPFIRRSLISRMAHVRHALQAVTARGQQTIQVRESPAASQTPANLLSIGVHPDWRGSGLAEQLADRYCEALWEDGWERVWLSVRPDNQRAIAFYEKTGWQRVGASAATVQYARSTRPAIGGPR